MRTHPDQTDRCTSLTDPTHSVSVTIASCCEPAKTKPILCVVDSRYTSFAELLFFTDYHVRREVMFSFVCVISQGRGWGSWVGTDDGSIRKEAPLPRPEMGHAVRTRGRICLKRGPALSPPPSLYPLEVDPVWESSPVQFCILF